MEKKKKQRWRTDNTCVSLQTYEQNHTFFIASIILCAFPFFFSLFTCSFIYLLHGDGSTLYIMVHWKTCSRASIYHFSGMIITKHFVMQFARCTHQTISNQTDLLSFGYIFQTKKGDFSVFFFKSAIKCCSFNTYRKKGITIIIIKRASSSIKSVSRLSKIYSIRIWQTLNCLIYVSMLPKTVSIVFSTLFFLSNFLCSNCAIARRVQINWIFCNSV